MHNEWVTLFCALHPFQTMASLSPSKSLLGNLLQSSVSHYEIYYMQMWCKLNVFCCDRKNMGLARLAVTLAGCKQHLPYRVVCVKWYNTQYKIHGMPLQWWFLVHLYPQNQIFLKWQEVWVFLFIYPWTNELLDFYIISCTCLQNRQNISCLTAYFLGFWKN